jgi:hypothetical protein
MDDLWQHLKDGRQVATNLRQQAKDDSTYLRLPDIVAEYKTLRVPVDKYVQNQCRFCKKTFRSKKYIGVHLGLASRGKSEARNFYSVFQVSSLAPYLYITLQLKNRIFFVKRKKAMKRKRTGTRKRKRKPSLPRRSTRSRYD